MPAKISVERAAACVTHHYACDCREFAQQQTLQTLLGLCHNTCQFLEQRLRLFKHEDLAAAQRLIERLKLARELED